MAEKCSMTLRVERQLRDMFNAAAKAAHRPAAQILREFMRSYVDSVTSKNDKGARDRTL